MEGKIEETKVAGGQQARDKNKKEEGKGAAAAAAAAAVKQVGSNKGKGNKDFSNLDLEGMPTDDLKTLHFAIMAELQKRKSVQDLIEELEQAFDKIHWGSGAWNSKTTCNAVDALEGLGSKERVITKKILALSDVEEKWTTALSFSRLVIRMIRTAHKKAFKLVNGSEGDWCPEAASSLEDLWSKIVGDGSRVPCASTLQQVCKTLDGSLGDYENDLGSILSKAKPSKKKKQKTK